MTPPLAGFPTAIDINPTARCNLECSFCWGPEHTIPDGLSLAQWTSALEFFAHRGTSAVVVTGGEPLIREDLPDLLQRAKELGLRVTLSTNALLLGKRHATVLPFVDEIGLPLDGASPEDNQVMRRGTRRSFGAVIDGMALVRSRYPTIEITVRTVVSRVNLTNISCLARLLGHRVGLFDRWKLYEFTPFSIGATNREEHRLEPGQFDSVVAAIGQMQDLVGRVAFQTADESRGRYVFVGPLGEVYGVDAIGRYGTAGNVVGDCPDRLTEKILRTFDGDRNASHGSARIALRVLPQEP